jgi:hypothetical protein
MAQAGGPFRMRVTELLVMASMLLLALVGCGGSESDSSSQQEEAEEGSGGGSQEEEAPVVGEFVGEAPDADAFLALVADEPQGGEEARDVRIYLCDGQTVSDWFRGSVVGNDLELSSDSGAQLEGELTPDAATGTITDPNGGSVSFEASPATGIAGLYDVNLSADGTLSGTSESGGQLQGQLGNGNTLEQYGTYPVSGTITAPDGQPQDFRAFTSPNTSDHHRWIVLADGQIKGANVGGGFEFEGFVFEQRFDCEFDHFDDFDFDDCDFGFDNFVIVFEQGFDDFDDFDDFDFERGRDQVGGTFGQVGGGGQGGQGGGKGGDGGKGGGGGVQKEVRMGPIPGDAEFDGIDGIQDGGFQNGKVKKEQEAAKGPPDVQDGSSNTIQP